MLPPPEIKTAFRNLSDAHFAVVLANFRIGQLIHETARLNSTSIDEVIKELTLQGFFPGHLYNCCRAYRKFKTETFLTGLRNSFNGIITWSFIVNYILEAPEGEEPEAIAYWEEKLRNAEKVLATVEDEILQKYHKLPAQVKSRIEGFLISLGYKLPEENTKTSPAGKITDTTASATALTEEQILLEFLRMKKVPENMIPEIIECHKTMLQNIKEKNHDSSET